MKKITYECQNCGHIFEGDDLSTNECPICNSPDLKKKGGIIPPVLWKIFSGIVGAIILIVVFKHIDWPENKHISADMSIMNGSIRISVHNVSERDLKSKYKIVMTNNYDAYEKPYHFDGKRTTIDINTNSNKISDYQFISGVIYTFNFVEKRPNSTPDNFRWNGQHTYYHPFPPTPPIISIQKEADCSSNTYIISISIKDGKANIFCLDDKEQEDSVFYDVKPRTEVYKIKAYDSENKLWSDICELYCKPIRRFQITDAEIDKYLSDISQRKIQPGTALEKINNNNDIKLSKEIDGNRTLEAALDYAYNQKVRYKAIVQIEHQDCNDRIVSITLSR